MWWSENYNFYTRVTNIFLMKMFKSPILPPAKKISAINWHLIYCLKGMKTRILMFLGDVCESKRKAFP